MVIEGALASMIGTIPVVVIGGVVYKMTEAMLPKPGQVVGSKKKVKRSPYNREHSGDFSNVGF